MIWRNMLGCMRTRPVAMAMRAVSVLAEMSTMFASPAAFRWLNPDMLRVSDGNRGAAEYRRCLASLRAQQLNFRLGRPN